MTVIRYINRGSTAGGDGTTNNTTGATRAYASMSEWEAAEQAILTEDHIVYCSKGSGGTDTTDLSIAGWTTYADKRIIIEGHPSSGSGRYTGTSNWSTSHYIKYSSTNFGAGITISESYVIITGLQFQTASTSFYALYKNGIDVIVEKCRFSLGFDNGSGIRQNTGNGFIVRNNIFTCTSILPYSSINIDNASSGHKIYNNTINGGGGSGSSPFGIYINSASTGSTDCKNNAIFNIATTGYDIQGTQYLNTLDYNAGDDSDVYGTTNGQNLGNTTTGWNNAFTSYSTGVYTIKNTSSVLYNNGIGNDSDGYVPLDDINDNPRNTDNTGIGAFAYSTETGPAFIPYAIIS